MFFCKKKGVEGLKRQTTIGAFFFCMKWFLGVVGYFSLMDFEWLFFFFKEPSRQRTQVLFFLVYL